MNLLWYCATSCDFISGVQNEHWYYVIFCVSECTLTRSSIMESCGIFYLHVKRNMILCSIFLSVDCALILWNFVLYIFHVWNALCYCGNSCHIFLCMEHALVLHNFVLYIFYVWNTLWYCGISCFISRVERVLVFWFFLNIAWSGNRLSYCVDRRNRRKNITEISTLPEQALQT